MTQTLPRVRAADVNSGRREREVKVVSTEENGKLKTYKTYRDLDIEYILKKEEKSRQKKLRTLTQLKKRNVVIFPSPCLTDKTLHFSPPFLQK